MRIEQGEARRVEGLFFCRSRLRRQAEKEQGFVCMTRESGLSKI